MAYIGLSKDELIALYPNIILFFEPHCKGPGKMSFSSSNFVKKPHAPDRRSMNIAKVHL